MKTSRFSLLIVSFLLLFACNNSTPVKEEQKDSSALPTVAGAGGLSDSSSMESKALDMVADLPEVEEMRERVDRISKGQNEIKLVVFGTPEPTVPYFTIKVMEDNGDNLVTQMCFRVAPEASKIMYYDVAEDSTMSLEEWRKK